MIWYCGASLIDDYDDNIDDDDDDDDDDADADDDDDTLQTSYKRGSGWCQW